jgi:hypothetical protein
MAYSSSKTLIKKSFVAQYVDLQGKCQFKPWKFRGDPEFKREGIFGEGREAVLLSEIDFAEPQLKGGS